MKLMSLKSKEIKEKLAQHLSYHIASDGFVYKKGKNEFINSYGEMRYIFNMLLTAWSDHYSISVRLNISQENIEEIYERILGKSHRLTIENTIERIYVGFGGKWLKNADMSIILFENEDIEAAVDTLVDYYNNIAKPYYKLYQTLDEIDKIINNVPFDHCPEHVGGNFDDRCMKGLIVARLVQNPKYDQLVNIYNEKIKDTMNYDSITNYYKVKEYLMYNSLIK